MAVHGTRQRASVSWNYSGLVKLLSGLARERTGLPVLRCYWYEAPVEGRFIAEHDTLADIPGLKLRLARMRPGRQDGVEAEMHRDLTTLARNGGVADAVIASAHEDLAGVVAEVQDLGMRVMLVHITADGSWTVSRPLRQECDDIIDISGAHLRPFVDLISGAEPAGHDRQYANGSYQHQSLTNGRTASVPALTHQAPAALPAPSSLAFYNPPPSPEYQPAANQPQGPDPTRQNSAPAPRGDSGQPAPAPQPAQQNPPQQALMPQPTGQQATGHQATGQQHAGPQAAGPQPPSQQAPLQQAPLQQAPLQQALTQAPQAYTAMAPAPVAPAGQQAALGGAAQVAQAPSGPPPGPVAPPVSVPTATILAPAPPAPAPSHQAAAQPSGSGLGAARNAYRSQDGPADLGRQGGGPDPAAPSAYAAAPVQQQVPQPPPSHSLAPQQPGTPMPGQDGPRLVGPGSPYLDASESPRLAEQAARFAEPRFAESRFAESPGRYADAQVPTTRYADSPGHTGFPEGQAQSRFADSPGHTGYPESQAQNRFGDNQAQARFADATGQVQYPPAQLPGYSQSQREPAPYGGQQPGPAPVPQQQGMGVSLAEAVQAAHAEGFGFGDAVARDAPALWLEAVLARKPRMPSDLEARLMQGSALPIDSLLHDEVRHSLRRGFWDALERSRR
jgi:hypothetical protein